MARDAARRTARLFAALGDETRLALIERLSAHGPASLAELSGGAGVTRQAIAKHLRVLAEAGLVTGRRHGRTSEWTLEPARLGEAHRALDVISRRWDAALARLRAFVEEPG